MENNLNIAYYATGHGLGHATRVIEIARHLLERGHLVTIVTGAPLNFFTQQLPHSGPKLRAKLLDSGAFQLDAFTVDMKKSLEEYKRVAQDDRETKLGEETQWLIEGNFNLVVSDAVPLACACAHAAGIPSVCVTNFSWDFIYSEYLSQVGIGFRSLIWQIAEDYAKANLVLRLPGHCPMPAFREVIDVPLVSRIARKPASQVRQELGIETDKKIVVLMYGGQPSGDWIMKSESLPEGWICIVCSSGKLPGGRPLPKNFILADKEIYTPDLIGAADCILGKIGYGSVSEALVHGKPFVFTRRDYFNEEPFLRKLLEIYGLAVEMRRRDFLEGNWRAFINKAVTLQSSFKQEENGAEVVAGLLVDIANENLDKKNNHHILSPRTRSNLALQRTTSSLGSTRLKDAVVYGYVMQRHAKRERVEIPEWYASQFALVQEPKATIDREVPSNLIVSGGNERVISENEDTHRFLQLLEEILRKQNDDIEENAELRAARGLFQNESLIYVARAPGRLDVMGGIADYSGSLVLEMPIAQACHVAAQIQSNNSDITLWKHIQDRHEALNRKGTPVIRIVSLRGDMTNRGSTYDVDLSELTRNGKPVPYNEARTFFKEDPSRSWAAYIVGAMIVLMHELQAEFKEGISLLVSSEVPDGKGVSSSAALEVASMSAISHAYNLEIQPSLLASLCQKVENLVVGAPCGVMDQMASVLGQKDSLMALQCQPAKILPSCVIPPGIKFWGIDSGVRHSVGGNDYGSVRAAAFMGLKIISHIIEEISSKKERKQSQKNVSKAGNGYLTNISPSLYRQFYESKLPETLLGSEFLEDFGDHWDSATVIEPDIEYPVAQATQHAIQENFRVHAFRAAMSSQEADFPSLLGEIMYQSHASYSRCGLGSDATDRLVDLARQHVSDSISTANIPGIFGAKITGGGSGGTVCFIGRDDPEGEDALAQILDKYSQETGGSKPFVFRGSSMGASDFGILRVQSKNPAS